MPTMKINGKVKVKEGINKLKATEGYGEHVKQTEIVNKILFS